MGARRKRLTQILIGIALGILIGNHVRNRPTCAQSNPIQSSRHLTYHSQSQVTEPQLDPPAETIRNSSQTLIFVGVMTAQRYLDSRADAVYNTWGRQVPGRIAFFSSAVSKKEGIPLVALPGVDDRYPPQKKSFMMLKYMYEHYGDKFEWFMRADDDVYVRMDRLEVFLRSIDSTKVQFIGQAGRGNSEEFGMLSLDYNENFCMGGPGIILSRETLKKISSKIDFCLNNMYTNHEDVEVGRCVRKFAGIPCTWSYEMQSILYHNQSGSQAFTGNLKLKEVHRAITLHPVKTATYMYRLHNYFKQYKIQSLKQEYITIARQLADLDRFIPKVPDADPLLKQVTKNFTTHTQLGLRRHQPSNISELLVWDFIAKALYTPGDSNPRRKIDSALKEGLDDVVREVMEIINMYSKQRGRVIDFREILYAYRRVDPRHGVDWVLDMLLVYRKYRGHKMTVPVRRHAYIQQTLTGLEIRELLHEHAQPKQIEPHLPNLPHPIKNVLNEGIKKFRALPSIFTNKNTRNDLTNLPITLILPLQARYKSFVRFIKHFENVCLEKNENVKLIVVNFKSIENVNIVSLVKKYRILFGDSVQLVEVNQTFSRAIALEVGIEHARKERMNEILFFIDVDMIFTDETLMRVRLNTIPYKQVYFPIVFSEYDPKYARTKTSPNNCQSNKSSNFPLMNNLDENKHELIHKNLGYWRLFGYGIVSIYKNDYENVGKFNTSIRGWGLEDVSFFETVLKSNLTIFRAIDPHLRHVYHRIECSDELSAMQKEMCLGSAFNTMASWDVLNALWMADGALREFAKNRTRGDALKSPGR